MKMKNVEDIYPLSSMQEGILFHTRHDPTFAAYFEIITGTLHGDVDLAAFAQAWQSVVDRHAVLRTAFVWQRLNEPVQVVRKRAKLEINHLDWRSLTEEEQEKAFNDLSIAERTRGFDLSRAPLMRVALIHLDDNSYRFVWVYHHGLIDGWSGSIVFNDVFSFYEALTSGVKPALSPPPSFRSYIEWVRKQDLDQARDYWKRTLKDFNVATPIPFVRDVNENVSDSTRSYRELVYKLTAETTARLVQLSRQNQLTLNTICQSAWALLLNRYTGEREVVFGVAVSGRSAKVENIESMVGMLVNTLPARIQITPDSTLIAWLKELQRRQWEMLRYEYSPLVQVREWSEVSNSSHLFQSILGFENHPIDYSLFERLENVSVRDVIHYHTATGYPINIIFEPTAELTIKLLYDFSRIEDAVVERIVSHLSRTLIEMADNPERRVSEFFVLTPEERQQMLFDWNETAREYRRDVCLNELFEEQVARTPEQAAVIFGDQQYSFAELNERADTLAQRLRQQGVGPEVRVALCMERSPEMIIAVLAIWKAGGVYVPLDITQPEQRLQLILDDANVKVVLTQSALPSTLPQTQAEVLVIDQRGQAPLPDLFISQGPEMNEAAERSTSQEEGLAPAVASKLAYIIYTSGSTGTPKGVMVTHRSAVNLLTALQQAIYDKQPTPLRVSVNAQLSFDASVKQLLQLLSGHTLVIIPEEIRASGPELLDYLSAQQVDVFDCTPSQLQLLLTAEQWTQAPVPRLLLVGGESIGAELWEQLAADTSREYYNVYGPTECTVDSTAAKVQGETPNIGRPLANTRIYLLDEALQPVPLGVRGEICIAGDGLARGYLRGAAQTAWKFVPEPFSGEVGARMYRTGDLGRYLEDGRLEFLGRRDHQVKLRGVRIELGEIEAALRKHPAVHEAVVQVQGETPEDRRLIAYVTPQRTRNLPLVPKLTGAEKDELLSGKQVSKLPNGMLIAGHGALQMSGLYREIFEDNIYFKNGIRLDEGACVFDVGANIGLFTLFVKQQARHARVYSFEPLPPNFAALQTNVNFYGLDVKLFECGLSNQRGRATFTFYPHAAAMSGKGKRIQEDKALATVNVGNWMKTFEHDPNEASGHHDLDNFIEHFLINESYTCDLRTVSEIIREHGIERIDLLKLDVERSEFDVLSGIEDEDWKKIRQFVMEVHSDELLDQISALLRRRGFTFVAEDNAERHEHEAIRSYILYAWDAAQREASFNGHESSSANTGPQTLPGVELSANELRQFLEERLPGEMTPSAFVILEEFPLTRGGKIDRRALPTMSEAPVSHEDEYIRPRTPVEEIIADICAAVLHLDKISVKANFFDLGGHSLLVAQVLTRVRETFHVNLSLAKLFMKPTVEGLSENVEKSLKAGEQVFLEPIPPASREQDLPLSFSQQRLWFLDQMEGNTLHYNVTSRVRLQGDLNLKALAQALTEIVRRHEILRTTFASTDGQPTQIINPVTPLSLTVEDVPGNNAEERASTARSIARDDAEQPFDLSRGPLFRIRLLRLAEAEHLALLTMHHIISDGWSTSVLINELMALYSAFSRNEPSPLPELTLQYVDYAIWQRQWLQGEILETQVAYWRKQLEGAPALLELPTDHPRPPRQTFNGTVEHWKLGPEVVGHLRELSRDEGTTLYMTLLAAFTTLLYRYSGQADIVIGTDIANRMRSETENLIGFLANMVVLRSDLSDNPTFVELLGRVRETTLGAYAHQDLPFEKLVKELQPERSLSHSPFFNVIFVLQNTPSPTLEVPGLTIIAEQLETNFTRFDLEFHLWEREGELSGFLSYNTDLFERATITRLLDHFTTLLDAVIAEPDRRISSLALLTADEKQTLLTSWNKTNTDYPKNSLIQREFELQVERTPQATALVFGDREMTYDELNRRANQLAHHLASLGVGPEVPVALFMERSLEMVVALLGVLKTGGYYVPLDRDYPMERLLFMLDDCAAPVVLTQSSVSHLLPSHWSQVIELDTDWDSIAAESEANFSGKAAAENLAYVMYTSGSTGEPKGVAVPHRGVLRLVKETNYAKFGTDQVFLQMAPITFDASTFEIWGSLLNGGRLVIMPPENGSLQDLGAALQRYGVTTLWLTAGLFHLMVNERPGDLEGLQQLLAGGDVLSAPHVQSILGRLQGRVINGYGPTENTTFTCCYPMSRDEQLGAVVPIGYPISNTQVYLLNGELEPVPVGANGELYTGGDGLARGYHNRPDLTAERFIPHPFGKPGERLYSTGDLARYLPDGRIEFLGRLDHQVKVRGFRIELDEIELALGTHPAVRQCVVLARDDSGREKQLVAYVLLEEEQELTAAEMRSYLGQQLPEYMIPPQLVVLDAFPLTANGKVNRQALPAPAHEESRQEFVAPRTAVEQALAEIWQLVLGVERVSIHDNFFDLGGDSIRSIQVHAQAEKRGYEFSVLQTFQYQTIAELAREAKQIDAGAGRRPRTEAFSLIDKEERAQLPDEVEDAYPLSFLQQGMLYHSDLHRQLALYHVIFSCQVIGSLDFSALQTAVQQLVVQHPILRTSFDLHSYNKPLQLVHREASIPFTITDLQHLSPVEQKETIHAWKEEDKKRGFEWTSAPLLRMNVFICGTKNFRVIISFPHAILDGWSLSSMLSELFSAYLALRDNGQGETKAPLATTFRDFIALEQESLRSEEIRNYWSQKLAALRFTALPPREGPANGKPARQFEQVRFGSELVEDLKSFARLAGVPLKSVLLAAHCKVLGLLSGQSDVTSGLVSNGRPEEADGDRALGLFLNTIPFSLNLKDATWLALAQAAADAETALGPARRYPLPELQRAHGGQPLFEFTFNYTHFHILEHAHEAPNFKVTDAEVFSPINYPFSAGFDLNNSELILILESDSTRLSPSQIDEIRNYYSRALHAMVAHPFSGSENNWAFGDDERQRVLVEWNDTSADYPADVCLHQLIETQAARTPEAVALISTAGKTSYRELNERANQLAHYLKSLGVGPEILVGVMLDRSVEMVVALLGILKAGGAYVPLDPEYPRERLRFMIEDSGARVLLTRPALLSILPETEAAVLCVDELGQATLPDLFLSQTPERSRQPEQRTSQEEGLAPAASNLAYVIYTSGSTGTPKGAMVTHGGVVNCLLWMQETYALTEQDRMLCKTTLNFDPSVWEVFWPLLSGGQVVLTRPGEQQNVAALLETIVREQVTIAYFVPSLLSVFLAEEQVEQAVTLKQVICGGESLPDDLVKVFYERLPHATLHHSYGPTETAIASSETVCERNSPYQVTPIGRPLANTQLYVLDEQMQPVPTGVIGELYIGGSGVGRGYLNQPELTATKFVPDLFGTEPSGRLYRTGDMVRYLADGNLEFHGRRDEQVKLRGVRIELGEIENVIRAQEGVRAAVVMMRADQAGENSLVAYVVAEDGLKLTSAELRHTVAQQLPVSMVPATFVSLPTLPLLPNGKIDRAALPEPEFESTESYVAPRDEVENLIAGVWADVLDRERVSIHDDFFALGGDSLTATQVMARLFDVFHIDLGLRTLFEAPTIAALAESVSAAVRGGTLSESLALMPRTRPELLPLSFAQQRLWFLEQMESTGAYHIPVIFRIRGRLDVPVLERVIDEIARRHESLRTTFHVVAGEPIQVISPPRHVPLALINLSELPEDQREAEAVLLSSEHAHLTFDLTTGPLVRARLLRLSEEEHVLQITLHHLIADGWSVGVLARETRALYEAFTQDKPSPLPDPAAQYADFALWQREWLKGELLESQVAYWREQLAGAPSALELPTDHLRPPVQSFQGGEIKFEFSASLTEALNKLSRREGVTIFMTLLTAFSVLLSRYADQEDVVVGTPIANRQHRELEGLIGFFVNTLALRVNVQRELTFRELLRNVREVTLNAYANQDVPFERLVEELQPPRELNRSPLFQVMLGVQNTPHRKLTLPGLEIGIQDFVTSTTRFDLECFLNEEDGELHGNFIYNTDLFERQTIENMLQHLQRVLELVVEDPKQQVRDLRFLTPEEDHQQLVEWNNTKADYPRDRCVHELFEEQVARTPSNIAIEFGDQRLSYSEFNRRAGELAARLQKVGVGPGTVVGICLERSPEALIALLGVLKVGGAYMPLDPAYPKARLAYMLDDSGSQVLITHTALRDRFSVLPERVLYVDDDHSPAGEVSNIAKVTPDSPAYLIYTSGSTGTPKGVAMPHRSLVNLITWQIARSGRPAPRTLQFASLSFDVSFQESFSTWCAGGTLILIGEEVRRDPERLWSTLARKGVERLFLPCVALQSLAEVCLQNKSVVPRLREVVSGGEQLKITPQIRELFATLNGCLFDNHYGPTETHAMTAYRLARDENSWPDIGPIGRPISNVQVYVLDQQLKPGPAGVIGEVYISGDCLSLGYLHHPEATAEKFIPNPFSETPGARMYRTGDLARLLSDGNIEFFGRRDGQLKIRGYRVEVGEIETALAEHPSINEAVVVAQKGESGGVRLVAYARVREAVSATQLRQHLKERLPEYMIPASFVTVEKFPLTPSGKIDRRGLLSVPHRSLEEEFSTEVLSPTAELIAGIWAEVLETEHVNANDNFFDLNGHSLLATRVASRIREAFNLELPLRRLFEYPTVLELAAHIDEQLRMGHAVSLPPIRPQSYDHTRPLSFAQQRLWFWEQLEPGTPTYNLSTALRMEGDLDLAVLERSLNEIVRRHEILRTSFTAVDGEPVQLVAPKKVFRVNLTDLSAMPAAEREAEAHRLAGVEALRPFALAKSPLLRVSLLRLGPQEHVAVVTMHHIVSDGWSLGLLIDEVTALYEAYRSGNPASLPELPVQYGDFAHWQNELLQPGSELLETQLAYWKEQLRDVPELALPTDRPRPAVYDPRGALIPLHYSADLSRALKKLSRSEDVTLFMTVLSAYNVLLHLQSGQEDIVIGTPIANRTRLEMEKLIGFFVNMLALRTDLSGDPTFLEVLQRTREAMIGAYSHQDVPFAKLVGELNVKRDASRNPLFQVVLIFDNTAAKTLELPSLTLSPFEFRAGIAPFDLSLFLTETPDGLRGSVVYNTALFEEQTIRRLFDHYENLLERVVADPNQRLSSLQTLALASSAK